MTPMLKALYIMTLPFVSSVQHTHHTRTHAPKEMHIVTYTHLHTHTHISGSRVS
jgi:hypothetical protein